MYQTKILYKSLILLLFLFDHQPLVQFPVQSIDNQQLISNVTCLAGIAKALSMPIILTTVGAKNNVLADPLFSSLTEVFPDVEPIDRTTTNAWSDPNFKAAVEKTNRKKLIMSGLWTEVCLAQTVIGALNDGFEVFIVTDCSGGLSVEAHERGVARLIQAGAVPMTWAAVLAELAPDFTTPEYNAALPAILANGGGVSLVAQYVMAQLKAGIVKMPEQMNKN